ncbi:MAG: DUF488 domain-containing protein [Candidatus Acidiferrum sp.]
MAKVSCMAIQIKRAYEPPVASDGTRVLIDRLWPRGLTKQAARIDRWLRELAPSNELRKWYHQRPEFFAAFRKRYFKELAALAASAHLEELYKMARKRGALTLIYSAKNEQQNNAVVLKELLEGMRKPPSSSGPAHAAAARVRAQRPR